VDERSGYVFVANSGEATVSMLDARTGTVVHTVAVGLHPCALAVDARSRRTSSGH
jgi:YVTN family beta-propeller protein